MGDSPVTNSIENIAGRGIGALAALTSLKGGGLQNYFINRQRMIADPGFRATLVGSPFTAGVFGQSQTTAGPGDAMPAAATPAQPSDFVGPSMPAASHAVATPSDIAFLHQQAPDRRALPNLPPLAAQTQVEVQAAQGIVSGLQSTDPVVRAQAKLAGKIPLTPDETQAATGGAMKLQGTLGPGSTVGLQLPGMPIQIGSPYNLAPVGTDEYASYDQAAAAAAARGGGWSVVQTNRGTWKPVPPPTHEQQLPQAPPPPVTKGTMPGAPPAPVMRGGTPQVKVPGPTASVAPTGPLFAGAVTTTEGPPPTVATRTNNPGNIKDGPFARSQPGYVGTGPPSTDGGNFAVFDSPASGHDAMGNLLNGRAYQGLTVDAALNRWSNGGYGGNIAAGVGIDPTRSVSSLNDAERHTLTAAMAQREGFQGDLTAAAPPPPPPAPTPPPPARKAAPAAPAFDPNATVPHVIVPAPAPAEEPVGYPPAAPAPPPGTIVPTPIPTLKAPPAAAAPAGPPGAAELPGIPVDPNTGLPLQSRTYESQTGSATYTAPPRGDARVQMLMRKYGITDWAQASPQQINDYIAEDRALKQQDDFDKAAIERTQHAMTGEEKRLSDRYLLMKRAYDEFITQYSPKERAKFLGLANAPLQTLRATLGWKDAKVIQDFRDTFAPFALESLTDEKGKAQAGFEGIAGMAPSVHDSAGAFESHLQHFGDALNDQITLDTNTRALPVGAVTPAVAQGWLDAMRANRDAARAALSEPPPEGATPPPVAAPSLGPSSANAAPPPPPPATAPPVWQPNWIH